MRDTGTEWLYRLLSQPKRFKRQLVLPKFFNFSYGRENERNSKLRKDKKDDRAVI